MNAQPVDCVSYGMPAEKAEGEVNKWMPVYERKQSLEWLLFGADEQGVGNGSLE